MPWYQDVRQRVRFERSARTAYPGLRSSSTGRGLNASVTYTVTVDVPEYEPRRLTISMSNSFEPILNGVVADGPTDSPHRYPGAKLCMWYPSDPTDRRWVADDGLRTLIEHARIHLFKEAWWRETREWLGSQAPHRAGEPKNPK